EIVATDIKGEFKKGITAHQVVSAITTLQSKLKADNKQTLESGKSVGDIINLLKSGSREDVVKIQEALGMTPDATTLDKKADGLFGKRTLANLAAG
ncbi:MAG: hypothetical protein WCG98_07360, partial [bacterium]